MTASQISIPTISQLNAFQPLLLLAVPIEVGAQMRETVDRSRQGLPAHGKQESPGEPAWASS
jgi:hypothetical protein